MIRALRGAAGRVPFWVWPVLALALYAGYLHRQVARAERAAVEAVEAKIIERLKAYAEQARTLEGKVAELNRQGVAAAARTRQIERDLTAARAAGQTLEATGTVDEIIRFGQSLGYHPVPARRP